MLSTAPYNKWKKPPNVNSAKTGKPCTVLILPHHGGNFLVQNDPDFREDLKIRIKDIFYIHIESLCIHLNSTNANI